MEPKISVVQFLFQNDWKVLSESLATNPTMGSKKFSSSSDLIQFCSAEQSCLIITNVVSRDDLIQLATFLKISKKSLKDTILKVVVLNATRNKQYEKAIAKLGNVEILEPNVNVKALRFKMEFWMKAMKGQMKKVSDMNRRTIEQNKPEVSQENKSFVQWPSMECESDIWLLVKESDCKKIIGRWMVKLMGPSPYVGQWTNVPNKQNVYAFEIKKAFRELFVAGEGNWFFKGEQKPEYNWKENLWMFTGDAFELFFYDTKVNSRLRLGDKVLSLASNSIFAKTKETLIVDSFNKDLVFKNEGENLNGNSLEFENEGYLGGNLQGNVDEKTEEKGNLKGKLKADDKNELSEQETFQLREKEKAEAQRKPRTEEKNDPTTKRSLKTQAEEAREEAEKAEGQQNKAAAAAKKNGQSNDEIAANWLGKLSSDNADEEKAKHEDNGAPEVLDKKKREELGQNNEKLRANWDGKLSPQEQKAREAKERSGFSEKHSSPDLKGKTDPSEKLNSQWGGKGSSERLNTGGVSAPTGKLSEGSLLDLKNTDQEHQTHYKNHNEAREYEADSKRNNQYQEEDAPGAMGGKGQTDKLASHYGNGQKRDGKNPQSGNLDGDQTTDKLSSHMGRKNSSTHADKENNEEKSDKPALKGKGTTDKLQGHYGSTRTRKPRPEDEEGSDSVSPELESSGPDFANDADLPNGAASFEDSNVLSFKEKASAKLKKDILPVNPEMELEDEKLTEDSTIVSYIMQNNRKYDCKLDDYFEKSVIFHLQGEGLKNSEKAILDVMLDYRSQQTNIYCEGNVMSIDEDGSGGFFVTVEVSNNDAKKFADFMEILKSRQESIGTFLGKAKGF